MVRIEFERRMYTGRGVSIDIMEASAYGLPKCHQQAIYDNNHIRPILLPMIMRTKTDLAVIIDDEQEICRALAVDLDEVC
jgi:hypothetical protein